MVYVYYNLRLWVRKINKVPDTDAISLDALDMMSPWRVEIERHGWWRLRGMEEALVWLEHDANELEEAASDDLPLLGEIDLEQDEDIESLPQLVLRPPQRLLTRGRGERHPTLTSTLSLAVAPFTSGLALACPPTASRGKAPAMTFAHKRGRGNR
jgi:hypothetical protein